MCLNAGAMGRQDAESETLIPTIGGGFDDARAFSIMPMNSGKDYKARKVEVAQPVMTTPVGGNQGGDYVVHAFDAHQSDVIQYGDKTGPLDTDGHSVAIAFSAKDHGADATADLAPTLRAMPHAESHANGGGQVAVAFAQNQRDEVRTMDVAGALASEPGMKQQTYVMTGEQNHAGPSQANAGTLLRRVREEIGAQAFAEWALGILDSLQSPDVLRHALHGSELRPAAFSRSWVVYCSLSRPQDCGEGAVQSLREALGPGCPSPGWQPHEQFARKLGTYLSELPQPGAQAERFLRDLWAAAEGFGLLRKALSAVQDAWRSPRREGQPVRSGEEGLGEQPDKGVRCTGVSEEISRERVLRDARATSETRDVGEAADDAQRASERKVGGATLQVRRLTCEEAEFLQAFPRGYTLIPYRGKPAADGPRYKALGNSMTTTVIAYIGRQIERVRA